MSILGLQSGSWTAGSRQADQAARGRDVPRPKFDATGPAGTTADPTAPAAPGSVTSSNSFQALASDIQAMLVQAQASAAAGANSASAQATGGTATTTSVSPEQQLATDLQTFLANATSGQTASASPTDPTAPTSPTDPAAVGPHHHHHHHGGGQANASTAVAQAPTSSSTASASNGNQAISNILAGDISKALSAYADATETTAAPSTVITPTTTV